MNKPMKALTPSSSSWRDVLNSNSLSKNGYLTLSFLVGFCVFVPTLFSSFFGVSKFDCIKFFLYAIVYHGLNGFLIISLFKQNISDNLKIPAIIFSGIAFNIVSFFALSLFHYQSYAFLNVFVLLSLSLFVKVNFIEFNIPEKRDFYITILTLTLLSIPLFLVGLATYLQTIVDMHFTTQGAAASLIANHQYPYALAHFPEIPLFYNYGYHLELAFCSVLSSIPYEVLSSRIYPIYTLFMLTFVVYSFCKEYIQGKEISGWLTIINNFCIVGLASFSTGVFLNAVPSAISLVGSSTLGLSFFFFSIDRTNNIIKDNNYSYINIAFLSFIFLVGSISRSAFPVVLVGGLSLYIATELFRTLQIKSVIKLSILNILLICLFIITLIFAYGFLSSYSATGFLKLVLQNTIFPDVYFMKGINNFLSEILGSAFFTFKALIHTLILSGFLLIGFYYQIYKWTIEGINNLELLMCFCALTGLIVWNFTEAAGGSHYTFLHYSILIFGIFGANGTYLLFKDALVNKNKYIFTLCGLSIILLSFKAYEVYYELHEVEHSNLISYNKKPNYSNLSDEFLNRIMLVNKNESQVVFIPLTSKPTSYFEALREFNMMTIKLKNTPLYHESGMSYIHENIRNNDILDRIKSIRNEINNSVIVDDDLINKFKEFFPKKNIIFLIEKSKQITSKQVHVLYETPEGKIATIKNEPGT